MSSSLRTFGVKRQRSTTGATGGAESGSTGAAPALQIYRPLNSKRPPGAPQRSPSLSQGARSPQLAPSLQRSLSLTGSPSSSSPSPSPPPAPRTYRVAGNASARPPSGASASFIASATAAAATSTPVPAVPSLPRRNSSNSSYSSLSSRRVDVSDPFADDDDDPFGSATQPLDDADEPSPRVPAALKPAALSRASSTPTAGLSRANSIAGSSPGVAELGGRVSLIGAQREMWDQLRFLLEGLQPSESAPVRALSAAKLLHLLLGLQPPDVADLATLSRSSDSAAILAVMRSEGAFALLADAMPSAEDITLQQHELFATLFASVSLAASQDAERSNASFFSAKAASLLFALAMQSQSEKNARASGSTHNASQSDESPSSAVTPTGLRQKRRAATVTVTAAQLTEALRRQQTALLDRMEEDLESESSVASSSLQRGRELHLQSLNCLDYVALQSLTALSDNESFVQHLMPSEEAAEQVLRTLVQQLHTCRARIQSAERAQTLTRPTSAPKGGRKKTTAVTASPAEPSSEVLLLRHRLHCCLTLLENCLSHGSANFARLGDVQVSSGDGAQPAMAMQLLFDIMHDHAPNLASKQRADPAATAVDDAPSPLLLPSINTHSIEPLLALLRIMCNGTNRNEAGAAVLNRRYHVEGQEQDLPGLALVLRLLASVRWSLLSQSDGHELFNLLALGLPVLVNCAEESEESRKVIEKECTCTLLPENAELAIAAFAALPPSPTASVALLVAGDLPALDWLCTLFSHLHHQLQLLAAARDAKDAARAATAPAASSAADGERKVASDHAMELSHEEALADPFASFAAGRARAGDAASQVAPTSAVQAHLAEVAEAGDEEEEEKRLGYRTLASMLSLLLGFFATSSTPLRARLLSSLRLSNFAPLTRLIKEFLLLQSDAQLLQQEGLNASFHMLEALEREDRKDAIAAAHGGARIAVAAATSNGASRVITASDEEPNVKRARVESATQPSLSFPLSRSSSQAAATFDAILARQKSK